MDIIFRLSKKGVPHAVCSYKGKSFSVCFLKKTWVYRVFEWNPGGEQKKLLDIPLGKGGEFNLKEELDKLEQK